MVLAALETPTAEKDHDIATSNLGAPSPLSQLLKGPRQPNKG